MAAVALRAAAVHREPESGGTHAAWSARIPPQVLATGALRLGMEKPLEVRGLQGLVWWVVEGSNLRPAD